MAVLKLTTEQAIQEFDRRCAEFEAAMRAAGSPVKCTDGYRSIDEQNRLYAQGRTKPGRIVTKARGGESPHNYHLAKDYCFKLPHGAVSWAGDWRLFGKTAKDCGLEWGGGWLKFVDRPHIQLRSWREHR
jgi:peptidoglycan L-alanyl-D-glutamate endopeptidase CwlK